MSFLLVLKALMALIFVLGLLFLTLWGIRSLQIRMLRLNKASKSRIEILEKKRIDIKNTLVLLRFDGKEHLLLLGTGQSFLIETKAKK